ncbi:MAG: hypothetical protein GX117_09705 [Candidatus Hydrogenedentes bacterium]|nr:hypothetical protein [Candidatus Hydrogenedentota bacterium]
MLLTPSTTKVFSSCLELSPAPSWLLNEGRIFEGKRWNNLHFTNAFKQAAWERKAKVPYVKQAVLDLSKILEDYTQSALNRICAEIQVQIKEIDVEIFAEVNQSQEPTQNRFFVQAIEIASIFIYSSNYMSKVVIK